ncbi:hypothetical protein [Shewanella fidelis]|uniref:hypothetical protein n=1 Tax=Shewanella fidelis TaxID=173509 RepID=UPI000491EC6C|nr:hypothetical protein [Shewanella fidelis]
MTLSYKGIFNVFLLLICISAMLLSYLSFAPTNVSSQLNYHQYQQDIKQLLQEIDQHSSFAALAPKQQVKINQIAARFLEQSQGFTSQKQLQGQLQHLLSQLNDPAAKVQLPHKTVLDTLPVNLHFDGQYWLAFTLEGEFIDADFPFLSHIDGLPISRWLQASEGYLAGSLKQSTIAQAQWLTHLSQLRVEIGLQHSDQALLTLSDGESHIQRSLALVASAKMPKAQQPNQELILRLPANVNETNIATLNQHLSRQRESDSPNALIIDIRAIKKPQPQLMAWLNKHVNQTDSLRSTTLAVMQYKRFAHARADRIASQYIPITDLAFFEQTTLKNRGFDNQLNPNKAFSHYLVRRYSPASITPSSITSEQVPLFLHVDSSCEQECEWIALASKHWPQVALIGETTSGNLGPLYKLTLPNSGIQIQFSAGLTYTPDGQLFSGVGLAPEIPLNQQTSLQAAKQTKSLHDIQQVFKSRGLHLTLIGNHLVSKPDISLNSEIQSDKRNGKLSSLQKPFG